MSQGDGKPANLPVIEGCLLLKPLNADAHRRLATEARMAHAERGELLWLAGTPADFVAIIGTGFVKLIKNTPQGAEMALELLGPGQCMGILAVVEGRGFPLTAVAVTDVWYLKIPARTILNVYGEDTGFKDQVVRSIAPRLRKAHDMMSRLSAGRVEERLAAVLLILLESYGERLGERVRLTVPLTRQDLAEMAGTTVETAIRIMSRWQKEGVVATDHQIITVLREQKLNEALA